MLHPTFGQVVLLITAFVSAHLVYLLLKKRGSKTHVTEKTTSTKSLGMVRIESDLGVVEVTGELRVAIPDLPRNVMDVLAQATENWLQELSNLVEAGLHRDCKWLERMQDSADLKATLVRVFCDGEFDQDYPGLGANDFSVELVIHNLEDRRACHFLEGRLAELGKDPSEGETGSEHQLEKEQIELAIVAAEKHDFEPVQRLLNRYLKEAEGRQVSELGSILYYVRRLVAADQTARGVLNERLQALQAIVDDPTAGDEAGLAKLEIGRVEEAAKAMSLGQLRPVLDYLASWSERLSASGEPEKVAASDALKKKIRILALQERMSAAA